MSIFPQRLGVLAAIALVAALAALALNRELAKKPSRSSTTVPAVLAPGSSWNEVRAGILPLTKKGELTACGVKIGVTTFGVAHPTLPCGARIFVAYGDEQVLTDVVAHGPYVPGRGLDLTPALATKLGISGAAEVRWHFAE